MLTTGMKPNCWTSQFAKFCFYLQMAPQCQVNVVVLFLRQKYIIIGPFYDVPGVQWQLGVDFYQQFVPPEGILPRIWWTENKSLHYSVFPGLGEGGVVIIDWCIIAD